MSISLHLKKFNYILESEEPNSTNARELCKLSRRIHLSVWGEFKPKEYIESEVLPSFIKGIHFISQLIKEKSEADSDLECFQRNIKIRYLNLRDNYLNGKRSAFIPEDDLSNFDKKNTG